MYIKEASEQTGATQRAIRLYESIGLLNVRRVGKYRVYSEQNINLIMLIKEAQTLGISLSDLSRLKADDEDFDWKLVSDFLIEKQKSVEKEIEVLEAKKRRIESYRISINKCNQALDSDL
ncbi:MerR family transcriptional regulator [Veronia nyctiphanis]|uniref:MerR family transcriptional regulator n=1 Tax=Veronia nyctiphanis TaxID=1278244 RepID=A0A4Q0YP48_9GAMM|nr:MerR family transcriptional regulator [Veronia nyctiphanis]RXJ72787.1 MerR family transcriptional regulator [Veronia nyctiphanis]